MAKQAKESTEVKQSADGTMPRPASTEELRTAFAGAAIAANKVYATNTLSGVRLAFCEEVPEIEHLQFLSAVMLPYPTAMSLRDLLVRQLQGIVFEEVKPKD
jgi:hypothetical protein